MCYRVITHTMRCDMRPVISSGNTIYTDPFAETTSCTCANEHLARPWLQCDDHGCCMKTSKMEWCPEVHACNYVTELQRYVQTRPRSRNIWKTTTSSIWSLPPPQDEPESWIKVTDVIDDLFPTGMPHMETISPHLAEAVDNLVYVGRLIVTLEAQLSNLLDDIQMRRDVHDAFHGSQCERVLNEWECKARSPIETGEALTIQMRKTLATQRTLFNASWTFVDEIMRDHEEKMSLVKGLTVQELEVVWDDAGNRGHWPAPWI
ncbi:hypothetical protein FPOAC2_04555 [Fusarium poae]|uniref:Uncharacterized protein n=1 Tax=Fusarium poae TaxID=36050 RepID=A0A1B8ASZ1_FUSPO|nr:hypothetical protein FPOAC1_004469 [Fusarium poae]KAG8671228.1 hypothetical protein FPOAC1_004469 [Fusarium poae]OBS23481.1 hypothetical protein FPOA_04031 [Fusarium poae]